MSDELKYILLLTGAFLLLFGTAEFMYHRLKIQAEHTRKFVHLATGLLTLLFPILLENHWSVLFLCGSFALLLILSKKYRFLLSINGVERKTWGSIAFPAAVYVCFLAYQFNHKQSLYFYLPILVLAFCDPIAALTGKKWPVGRYRVGKDHKTLMGSGMFFMTACIVTLVLLFCFNQDTESLSMLQVIAIAAFAALAEGITGKGMDNLTIPLSVLIVLLTIQH